jgi:hypothetical protein
VKSLDTGQEREVAFVHSQRSAWVNLSRRRRILGAAALVLALASVAGVSAAVAGGQWVMVALCAAGLGTLAALPHVLWPELMLAATVRMMTPSAESIERGGTNRSWPG